METTNHTEFKQLLKLYSNITFEQVKQCYENSIYNTYGFLIMNNITGFGVMNTCMLCQNCIHTKCIYDIVTGCCCNKGYNQHTYYKIFLAVDARNLYEAIQDRIIHMTEILTKYEQLYGNKL